MVNNRCTFFIERSNMTITNLYKLVLKDSLTESKYKNSKITTLREVKKGSIACFRTKEQMQHSKGFILTSVEALQDNTDKLTHWTPNAYTMLQYANKDRNIIKGHSEHQLKQINTFFIDIDLKPTDCINENDILLKGLSEGLFPTFILKTTKGYQAYFVLKQPIYITAKSDFKSLKLAKKISENIRNCFNETLPVDMTCNHFGIARIPRTDNVVYINMEQTHSFQELMFWSLKQEPKIEIKPKLTLVPGNYKQVDEKWYSLLLNEATIEGKKSLYGRNNVLFTLALANYSSGVSESDCQEELETFNNNLESPLPKGEFLKTIKSAYKGRYQGASKEYVLTLCQEWINENLTAKDLFNNNTWYKFKKERKERKKSHIEEWEQDITKYLEAHTSPDMAYLRTTKRDLEKLLAIPRRSLDKALNNLKQKGKILFNFKVGRNGGIILATIENLMLTIIKKPQESKNSYIRDLSEIFEGTYSFIRHALKQAEIKYMRYRVGLFAEAGSG